MEPTPFWRESVIASQLIKPESLPG